MMARFAGLTAVVTGGSSGIGAAVATALLGEGANVATLDLETTGTPAGVRGLAANVRERASVTRAVAATVSEFGGIDILVNCAGISAIGTVEDNDDAEWAKVLDVNVTGTARTVAAALPHLRRSERASIVNVCSIAALNGLPQRALYSASKGAILSLTYAMAADHVGEGIRVNCVSPGTVSTPFVERMLQRFEDPIAERARLNQRQATGRMVTPVEVAEAVLYLASPGAGSTTGTALDVDGGVTHLRVPPSHEGLRVAVPTS